MVMSQETETSQTESNGAQPQTAQVEPSGTEQPSSSEAAINVPSPEQIKGYHRIKRACFLGGLVLTAAYWIVWVFLADDLTGWMAGGIENRWLGLFAAAAVFMGVNVIINLPLDFYSDFTLEHRYGLSNQTPRGWWVFQLKSWLIGGILGAVLLSGLYGALWYGGAYWGVWVWLGVMVLSVVLAKVFPLLILPLFYPSQPLDRPDLIERLKSYASDAGMEITGVFNLGLSKDTKKANAMLTGLGSSRRVYLSDTLLDSFNDDQVSIVFVHELGHHIRKHIFKLIFVTAVVSSLMVALIYWRLNPHAADPWAEGVAALAEVMLVMAIFPLLIGPITNAISRHFEREADWIALEKTDDPDAYRSAFQKLSHLNMADPDPPRWEEIMFDDHPALSKRIAMADRYEASKAS